MTDQEYVDAVYSAINFAAKAIQDAKDAGLKVDAIVRFDTIVREFTPSDFIPF